MKEATPADDLTAAGFATFTRAEWAALARGVPQGSPGAGRPSGDGPVPDDELDEVYRPLGRLLAAVAAGRRDRDRHLSECLGREEPAAPFVIGVAGSVAAGKSTVAEALRSLLEEHPALRPVEVMTTDSFLFANERLERAGLSGRKGYPESYDHPRLIAALAAIRSGVPEVEIPVYSHRDYDIVPGRHQIVAGPGTLIVEGLHVLHAGPTGTGVRGTDSLVSDYLDWSIFVDAAEADLVRWHCERLLEIHRTGSAGAPGFLGWFCSLSEEEARAVAEHSWWGINSGNLREHIAPTRVRASTVLGKGSDHRVGEVRVRTR